MHTPTAHEVETFSGKYVNLADPDPATIDLNDIAHALSNVCRFGGHCRRFYSVAEHAVFVSKRLERKGFNVAMQLAGLHHDDAEAYLGDIPRPLKPLLGKAYEVMSDKMDAAIVEALGLPFGPEVFHRQTVKDADNWSLFVEARHLLPSGGRTWTEGAQGAEAWGLHDLPSRIVTPDYWYCGQAPKSMFLERHTELTERVSS
jgi:hypothetical protein